MDNNNPLNLTDEQMRLAQAYADALAGYKEVRLLLSGTMGLELPYNYRLREQEREAYRKMDAAAQAIQATMDTKGDCWAIKVWAEENLTPKKKKREHD